MIVDQKLHTFHNNLFRENDDLRFVINTKAIFNFHVKI